MLNEAAVYPENLSGPFFSGFVGGRTGDFFHVHTGGERIMARKAGGCLLVPGINDRVLVFSDQEEHFILSILIRNAESPQENVLLFDGPTRLLVEKGDLALQSQGEIQVAAAARIDLASDEIRVHACKAEACIDQCTFWGRMLRVQVEVIKSAARIVDLVVKRWTMQADNSVRYIKEHDEVQAESARYLTEKTLTMHAKNAVHTAEELVSINGGQINLS
ncbi:MAG: DUF3540 domain-containing protein [Pseudomonadota bacterium]